MPSSNHQGDLVVDKTFQSMEVGKCLILSTYKEVIGNLSPIILHYINDLSIDNFPVST